MRMTAEGFDWICDTCQLGPRTRAALRLLWLDGYTFAAVAAELRISEYAVRYRTVARAKRRIVARKAQASPAELQLWELYTSTLGDEEQPESETEAFHARGVLDSMRGYRRPSPMALELDENGRPIAGHPPLVTVDEAVRLFRTVPMAVKIL